MTSDLPVDWTIERLRAASGDCDAVALPPNRLVTVDQAGQEAAIIQPAFVLAFHDLCLVQSTDDGNWYMGALGDQGSVACWASYGSDLHEAIKGL